MDKDKYFEKIRKKIGRSIYKFNLIEEGDKILLALSGGKDSLVLLENLAVFRKYYPKKYELCACHIVANGVGYQINKKYLEDFCHGMDVKLIFGEIDVDLKFNSKKHPCFVCSWHRRKKIFSICRELGYQKIAFGHHMDDAIETFFLNLIHHGSISSLPQKIDFFDGDITIIRPMLELHEEEITKFALLKDHKKELKSCDFEDKSQRFETKDFIKKTQQMNQRAKHNIFRAMNNIYPDYLPKNI